jgi:hypothetical protein
VSAAEAPAYMFSQNGMLDVETIFVDVDFCIRGAERHFFLTFSPLFFPKTPLSLSNLLHFFQLDCTTMDPTLLRCPITLAEMVNPVVAADGHTYERDAIVQWLDANMTSPTTGQMLQHRRLVTNWLVKRIIDDSKSAKAPVLHGVSGGREPVEWEPAPVQPTRRSERPVETRPAQRRRVMTVLVPDSSDSEEEPPVSANRSSLGPAVLVSDYDSDSMPSGDHYRSNRADADGEWQPPRSASERRPAGRRRHRRPKRNVAAYNRFKESYLSELRAYYPNMTNHESLRLTVAKWKSMSEEDRDFYISQASGSTMTRRYPDDYTVPGYNF